MQTIALSFSNVGANVSLQVGDDIFYATGLFNDTFFTSPMSTFTIESSETSDANNCQYLGRVVSMDGDVMEIEAADSISVVPNESIDGVELFNIYFFFSKNTSVNTASLKGYYGLLSLRNNALDKAELFNVSAEIVGSSK